MTKPQCLVESHWFKTENIEHTRKEEMCKDINSQRTCFIISLL